MKIEKLTDNKIRVILNLEDLEENNIKSENIISKPMETQNLFLNILLKAEKEVGFYTDGCRLLIEAFSSSEGIFVFTITKFKENDTKDNSYNSLAKKKLIVRRKSVNLNNTKTIYTFENFDIFCDFCNNINKLSKINVKKIAKYISLYTYNDKYYLSLSDINTNYEFLDMFYSTISEFATLFSHSESFEHKLSEHGKLIMKKNAISTTIKYFFDKV